MSRGAILQLALRHEILRSLPMVLGMVAGTAIFVFNILIFRAGSAGVVEGLTLTDQFLLQGIVLSGFVSIFRN